MSYLLDTHVILWALTDPRKLSKKAAQIIGDPGNEIFLSAVSIWETAIKLRSGRLELGGRSATDLLDAAKDIDIHLISLDADEAATHGNLKENTHFDPFDRMLIWQAIRRDLTLISADKQFRGFKKDGLKLLWE